MFKHTNAREHTYTHTHTHNKRLNTQTRARAHTETQAKYTLHCCTYTPGCIIAIQGILTHLRLYCFLVGSSYVERTLTALPQPKLKIMGQWNGFPQTKGVGKMDVGGVTDDKFRSDDIITWSNTKGVAGPYQWLGWQDARFSGKVLKYSFWIKFVGSMPAASGNFGMKVYGVLYNDFLKGCSANEWCYVEKTVKCAAIGDSNHVILIFDSIPHKQTVHISKFQVQIL